MHLRSANARGPVPKVRCKSRHDPEIQGRFSASSDGHLDVMGKVRREALERNVISMVVFFRHFSQMVGDTQRILEVQSSFTKQYHWGGWRCWLRVVIEWHHPSGKL